MLKFQFWTKCVSIKLVCRHLPMNRKKTTNRNFLLNTLPNLVGTIDSQLLRIY